MKEKGPNKLLDQTGNSLCAFLQGLVAPAGQHGRWVDR